MKFQSGKGQPGNADELLSADVNPGSGSMVNDKLLKISNQASQGCIDMCDSSGKSRSEDGFVSTSMYKSPPGLVIDIRLFKQS